MLSISKIHFWDWHIFSISVFLWSILVTSAMIELGFVNKKMIIFHTSLFLENTSYNSPKSVVSTRKSRLSVFQNIKNLWNRFIIREDIVIFVFRSIIIVCERVYPLWRGLMTVMRPHHRGYTRSQTIIIDLNTKIKIPSRIMNRFQNFWMFWKAEILLFHPETTFLVELQLLVSENGGEWKNITIFHENT